MKKLFKITLYILSLIVIYCILYSIGCVSDYTFSNHILINSTHFIKYILLPVYGGFVTLVCCGLFLFLFAIFYIIYNAIYISYDYFSKLFDSVTNKKD